MKPVIGLIPLIDEERASYWMLPGYMSGISEAGGIPLMLPLHMTQEDICQAAETFDGFLLTGGHDVSPALYGEKPIDACGKTSKERDSLETAVFKAARTLDKPMLGICRGIQLINVLMGGTLYQDIPLQYPSKVNHHGRPPYDQPVHGIDIIKGTPLYECCGAHMEVNSYHHQAVKTLAPGLVAMAYAPDGLIEAVYDPQAHFLWAVQFHPEFAYRKDEKCRLIFEHFVDACRK